MAKIYLEMKKCNIYHFFWKNASPKKNYIKRYAQDNGNTGSQYWSCAWQIQNKNQHFWKGLTRIEWQKKATKDTTGQNIKTCTLHRYCPARVALPGLQ